MFSAHCIFIIMYEKMMNGNIFQMKQKRKQMKKEGKSTIIAEDDADKVSMVEINI
jgi:hypothetical protein